MVPNVLQARVQVAILSPVPDLEARMIALGFGHQKVLILAS